MQLIERASTFIDKTFAKIGVILLIAMVLLIVGNMFMKIFFISYFGVIEIQGRLSALLIALTLGYTQLLKGHVAIQIVVDRFNPTTRNFVELVINFISLGFIAVVTWQLFQYAEHQRLVGSVSETLRWFIYPYIYLVALGFAGLALRLLNDFLLSVLKLIKKDNNKVLEEQLS